MSLLILSTWFTTPRRAAITTRTHHSLSALSDATHARTLHASTQLLSMSAPGTNTAFLEPTLLDGSIARHLDEWLYRHEQYELVEAHAQPPPHLAASSSQHAAAAGSATSAPRAALTPASLRPTMLRALATLRWSQVYLYYCPQEGLPARLRSSLAKLASCADELQECPNCRVPITARTSIANTS